MNDLTLVFAAITLVTAVLTMFIWLAETTPLGKFFERIGDRLAGYPTSAVRESAGRKRQVALPRGHRVWRDSRRRHGSDGVPDMETIQP